jgi:DNA (cytosine-5)-methyltransferase 1
VHGVDLGIKMRDKFTYLLTYSFPCTDLSVAGRMQGMSKSDWENGNSTRSGLLWEVERILKELKDDELPQVLLMENVPQVHAESNRADFESWLAFLRSRGYQNFWQDLNAKNYGIPQNRDRCFCVSFLSEELIDFEFPSPVQLTTVMRDYLEEEVDEKYYIKSEKADKLIQDLLARGILPQTDRQTDRMPNN